MGTLRSHTDWSHLMEYNGVELGDPVELDDDPTTWEWDDGAFPNGVVDEKGNVIPDEADLPE